ncbi:ferric-chelate reductase [Cucurbitaria berberidis CBS 394.84]|uniref:ferric-chelate reductase (NADPH) n=1 Tax=Cucurbitaria berberidis CBS 394.84 TaxID=1168544 RepID=A0A9P4GVL6_9PLEO|nr:ferric-chelate reductase [Cucurbitaria berberidis CBS 394.84]KAF1852099.1 ferric-chelate reductase [Cucurbitaria berberidis CBS 394.84]
MSMGHMSKLPALTDFPKLYYAVVGTAVGVATLVNLYTYILYRQRLSAARTGSQTPAKPKSWLALGSATLFAITREASNFSVRILLKDRILRLPTVGRAALITANVIVLVVLCLYGLDLNNRFTREDVGFRCGVITIGQLPLIFMLSGKNNIIGFLSGVSYERLNWIHRWCARCMLLTATLHMGYFFSAWAPYDYIGYQLKNSKIAWKGLAAWCTLVWIVFSSMTPIRGWCYELFVIQHVVSFALLLAFVYIHTPIEMNVYVWLSVGLFSFDRVFRALRVVYANFSVFHPSQKKQGHSGGFLTCKAEFSPLPHNTTRVVIRNPPISWRPGQHVFLSCHSVVPLQSHPFTVASIPEDGRMEFLIKSESGGTRRIFRHAEKEHSGSGASLRLRTVAIEGPYGSHRPLRQFDSIVLFAGSTGATFTMSLLRDIVQGWKENIKLDSTSKSASFFNKKKGAVTRHIRFVWVVKSKGQLSWFAEQLSSVYSDFQSLQERLRDIKLELTVYVTCDDSFTEEHKSLLSTITAPNPNSAPRKAPEHGTVEYRGRPQLAGLEGKSNNEKETVRELTSIDSENLDVTQNACGPDGTCCCRSTVDENAPSGSNAICCCCSSPSELSNPRRTTSRPISRASSTPTSSHKQRLLVHPAISVFAGRPKTRDIIRRSLEQALGESAVVVCGPQGLVADVRHDVCSLSDERAVHKGTGAQGIYLHTESFGY